MSQTFWTTRLWKHLNRPVFSTKVINKFSRVDPNMFPEEEFPVYCPQCEYLLRGLPDGRCPECGTPFTRERLLVKQYATYAIIDNKHNKQLNRFLKIWFPFAGIWFLPLYFISECVPNLSVVPSPGSKWVIYYPLFMRIIIIMSMLIWVALLIGISMVTSYWLIGRTQRELGHKCRRVREAVVNPPDEADERNTTDHSTHLDRETAMNSHGTKRLGEMKGLLRVVFVIQIFLLLLSLTILDGGGAFRFCLAGVGVHWMVVAYLALRRRHALTRIDQVFIAAGFIIYLVVAGLILLIRDAVINMLNR